MNLSERIDHDEYIKQITEDDVIKIGGHLSSASTIISAISTERIRVVILDEYLTISISQYENITRDNRNSLINAFKSHLSQINFLNGVNCEILQVGQRWRKGKLRLKMALEFISDEVEEALQNPEPSPLDEIRKMGQE